MMAGVGGQLKGLPSEDGGQVQCQNSRIYRKCHTRGEEWISEGNWTLLNTLYFIYYYSRNSGEVIQIVFIFLQVSVFLNSYKADGVQRPQE